MQTAITAFMHFNGGRLEVGPNWLIPSIDVKTTLTPDQNADIQQRRAKLYCVGYVSYHDAGKRMRITGFCRVLHFPETAHLATAANCRFRLFDDPDYEYQD